MYTLIIVYFLLQVQNVMEISLACIKYEQLFADDINMQKNTMKEIHLWLWAGMTNPMRYTCDDCKAAFMTMAELNNHYKHDHPKAHAKFTKDVSC